MPPTAGHGLDLNNSQSGGTDVRDPNSWEKAWNTLSDEDKEQYGAPSLNMLDTLKSVCIA